MLKPFSIEVLDLENAKFSLGLKKYNNMKTYGGVEV